MQLLQLPLLPHAVMVAVWLAAAAAVAATKGALGMKVPLHASRTRRCGPQRRAQMRRRGRLVAGI